MPGFQPEGKASSALGVPCAEDTWPERWSVAGAASACSIRRSRIPRVATPHSRVRSRTTEGWCGWISRPRPKPITSGSPNASTSTAGARGLPARGAAPKIEEYEGHLFFVFHAITGLDLKRALRLDFIELDGWLSRHYLVTVHDEPLAIVSQLMARVKANPSLLARGTDDLFYALLDGCVDLYFPFLDLLDRRIDHIEHEIFVRPSRRTLIEVFTLRKAILKLRRFAWPQRDTLSLLAHREHSAIDQKTRYYLRDVVDHLIRITDTLDSYRDVVSGAADTYISQVSQRTNDIIKVLSIIATIMLPLSFMAGLYGMNFEYLPGSHHPFGFQVACWVRWRCSWRCCWLPSAGGAGSEPALPARK
jgi:magnesium transporter